MYRIDSFEANKNFCRDREKKWCFIVQTVQKVMKPHDQTAVLLHSTIIYKYSNTNKNGEKH